MACQGAGRVGHASIEFATLPQKPPQNGVHESLGPTGSEVLRRGNRCRNRRMGGDAQPLKLKQPEPQQSGHLGVASLQRPTEQFRYLPLNAVMPTQHPVGQRA